MTAAPLTGIPADPDDTAERPPPEPGIPQPRRPRMRVPGYEPEARPALPAGGPGPDAPTRNAPDQHRAERSGTDLHRADHDPADQDPTEQHLAGQHPADRHPADQHPAGDSPADSGPADRIRPGEDPAGREPAGRAATGNGRRPPDGPPDPLHARAANLVRSMLEILTGRRPPAQLAGAAAPHVVRYLAASRPASVRAGRPRAARVGRVHVRRPHPDAAEVVAVCRVGDRVRALALRLDRDPRASTGAAGWTCTAVRLL